MIWNLGRVWKSLHISLHHLITNVAKAGTAFSPLYERGAWHGTGMTNVCGIELESLWLLMIAGFNNLTQTVVPGTMVLWMVRQEGVRREMLREEKSIYEAQVVGRES